MVDPTRAAAHGHRATPLRPARHPIALACALALAGLPAAAIACDADSTATLLDCFAQVSPNEAINLRASITLTAALPTIDMSLTINGNGHTLDGASQFRGLVIGSEVKINQLTMVNMTARGGDGGSGAGAGGGGMGAGGAIFVRAGGIATLNDVTLLSSQAIGGNGGSRDLAAQGVGGGGGMGGHGGAGTNMYGAGEGGGGLLADARPSFATDGGAGGGSSSDPLGPYAGWGGYQDEPGMPGTDYIGGGGAGAGSTSLAGGAGGFGAGGGGANATCTGGPPAAGGAGGFGGGAGGSVCMPSGTAGFGGGGAATHSALATPTEGGFGAGNGQYGGGGGGGAMGGGMFLMDGGTVILAGSFRIDGSSVTGGQGGALIGAGSAASGTDGAAYGAGIFLQGSDPSLQFSPGAGVTQEVTDDILDQPAVAGGIFTASPSVIKTGAGTTVLSGNNGYLGATEIREGTLAVASAASLGDGAVILAGGQLTTLSNAVLFPAAVMVKGGLAGTIAAATGTTLRLDAPLLTEAGSLLRFGAPADAGTVVLNTGPTWLVIDPTSSLQIRGGTLKAGNASLGLLTATAASTTVDLDATLDFNGLSATIRDLRGEGTVQTGTSGTAVLTVQQGSFAGSIEGAAALHKDTAGVLVLAGGNGYTGGTVIHAGTVQVGDGVRTGTLGAGAVVNDGQLVFNQGGPSTIANAIGGAGQVHHSGSGTLTFTGQNTYTGATVIDSGTLQVGDGSAADTGTLGTGEVRNDGTLAFHRAGEYVVANTIIGAGGLQQLGAGTTVLTGTNTYGGTTVVSAGTLQVGNGADTGTLGTGAVTNDGTLVFNRANAYVVANGISGHGDLTHRGTGRLVLTGNNNYGGTTTVSGGGTLAIAGAPSLGSGNVVISDGQLTVMSSMDLGLRTIAFTGGPATLAAATGSTLTLGSTTTLDLQAGALRIGTPDDAGTVLLDNTRIDVFPTATLWIAGGTLRNVGAGSGLSDLTGTVSRTTVDSGAVLDFGDRSAIIRNLRGEGVVHIGVDPSTRLAVGEGVFAGRIDGAGTLRAAYFGTGIGPLVLTGNNTYGATAVDAGATLQIGDGGSTGTLGSGAVSIDGTLVFDRSNEYVVANAISGDGSLVHQGTGRLVLTGANTYTGTTTVSAGTLSVNGSLAAAGTVNVMGGATLGGSGSMGAVTIAAGGFLSPGNSIGTLTVGDLAFAPGSTFLVEVDPQGNADRIHAANVTLSGANVQVQAGTGRYERNTRYTILSHSGTRTGSFADVASNLAFLRPTLLYEPGAVILQMLSSEAAPYSSVATSSNQASVASYLDSFASQPGNGSETSSLLQSIDNLDAQQARRAFDTLSGSVHASASQIAMALGRNFSAMLGARGTDALLDGERTVSSAGFTARRYAGPAIEATTRDEAGGQARAGRSSLAMGASVAMGAALPSPRRGLWAQAIGGGGRADGDGNGSAARYSSGGVAFGFDHDISERWMVGAALARTRTGWDASANDGTAAGTGSITSHQAGLYGRFLADDWLLRLDGTYGRHRFSTKRTISLGAGGFAADSNHTGHEWAFAAQAEFAVQPLVDGSSQLRPVVGLRHARFSEDGFTETGAAAASLTVADRSASNTTLQAGVRWLHALESGKGQLQLQASVSHLAGDNDLPVTSRMAGPATSFVAAGTELPRNALTLAGSASVQVANGLTVFADTALEWRGSGHRNYSVVTGLRKRW
jgi:autotransporter-associated beta strand protein